MVMRILAPLVAALVPLVITPGILHYFDITPKVIILLFGVSLMLLLVGANLHNLFTFLATAFGRWFAALLAVQWILLAIATALSAEPWLALNGSSWRRYGLISQTAVFVFALLTAAWLYQSGANQRTLLRAVSWAGGIAAISGIAQYFGIDPLLPARAYQMGDWQFTIVRPPGTLGNAGYFAAWLLAVVFSSVALAAIETSRWLRVVALTSAALSAVAIVLSGTRAAWLGLAVGCLILGVYKRAFAIACGVAIIVLIVFLISPAGLMLRARLHWSSEDPRGGARLLLWRDTLHMAVAKPVVGFGPEAFVTEFPRFESLELARSYPDFYHESPHNIWLDALVSGGPAAALGLAGMALLGLYAALKGKAIALGAGLVALLVCQQFTVFIVPTLLTFYLLIAVLIAVPHGSSLVSSLRSWQVRDLPYYVLALIFALYGIQLLVSDRALQIAHDRISAGNPERAAEAYRTVLRWQPAGSSADLDYSVQMSALAARTPVFLTRAEAFQQALDSGSRATATAGDRQNAWYHLATLLAAQNDAAGVERALRNAIDWAPNWFKPHWTLAQLLDITGRHREAVQEAELAARSNGGKNPEVANTLKTITNETHP